MFSPSSRPVNQPFWPTTVKLLDLSSNVGIIGPLPPAGSGYSDLATIDLSNTSVSGPLPASWSAFPSLQRLTATDTQLACALTFDAAEGSVSQRTSGRAGARKI
jgi:hypothetical protein